jgi:PEP-CTERM motif
MYKFSLAILALAATLAVAPPSALCDSFGNSVSGSRSGSSADSEAVRGSVPRIIADSGIFASSESPALGRSFTAAAGEPNLVEHPINGAFFFDNLFQKGNKDDGGRDNVGALIDLNGQEIVLISGNNGESGSGGKEGQFIFSDKGAYRVSTGLQKGSGTVRTNTTALTVTPEPGSLFLLGTGLLGLALVLFWKASRRPTGS